MDHTALCFMLIVACAGWVEGNPQPPTTTNASPPTTEESIHMELMRQTDEPTNTTAELISKTDANSNLIKSLNHNVTELYRKIEELTGEVRELNETAMKQNVRLHRHINTPARFVHITECYNNGHCPDALACSVTNGNCIDPCESFKSQCDEATTCIVSNHTASCKAPMITVIGYNRDSGMSSVESVNPQKDDSHCPNINDLPEPRGGHIAQVVQGSMIVCGGSTSSGPPPSGVVKSCIKYNSETGEWTETKPMTQARKAASSIVLEDDTIWITGGHDGPSSSTTAELWQEDGMDEEGQTMSLPERMGSHCMAKINKTHAFLAGGGRDDKSSYLVNIGSKPFTFSDRISLSNERSGAACGLLKKFKGQTNVPIIAGGGYYDASTRITTEILINGRWEPGPKLPRGFFYGGYTTQNTFMMIGGEDENDKKQKNIMTYNEDEEQFVIAKGSLQEARDDSCYSNCYLLTAVVTYSDETC